MGAYGLNKIWNSLSTRLTLFLLVLSVPMLVVIEFAVLSFEYAEVRSKLTAGALQTQTTRLAHGLSLDPNDFTKLALQLQTLQLQLHDPLHPWLENPYVLTEFSDQAMVLRLIENGKLMISTDALSGTLADAASNSTGGERWLARATVPSAQLLDGSNRSIELQAELNLIPPWRKASTALSLEWPVMVLCLLLLGLCAHFFMRREVVARLERIAKSAEQWSKQRLDEPLHDDSSDEIGVLSRRLNGVALSLRSNMEERIRLASAAERERLAQDLHDSVKQHGFALEMQLGALDQALKAAQRSEDRFQAPDLQAPDPARVALSEAQQLSVQLRRELDIILGQLRAPHIHSLPDAIRSRAQEFERRSGIQCRLLLATLEPNLQDQEALEVLKILDEALNNIVRHAKARLISISLEHQQTQWQLCILDDGIGLRLNETKEPGMGLDNMRDRATRLPHGALNIQSVNTPAGNAGTKVELTWQH